MLGCAAVACLYLCASKAATLTAASGTNALNVAVMLGIMALPTVVSVAEDALQAAGRDLREGSYALGATRAETVVRVVLPAAASGVTAAVILGVMRAVGETMVVWMASGNAAHIPHPWYNLLSPVRTLTATIAGDMGEADHVTGSARYHVLFAMALSLLVISFLCNFISERLMWRARKKLGG
jgi:phosphate transport system permease protein